MSSLTVSVAKLRFLLRELQEKRPDICVRYRLLGDLWITHFRHIILVTPNGAVFNDESINKLVTLDDLSQIMQFELDKPFQEFRPFFHYDVTPS